MIRNLLPLYLHLLAYLPHDPDCTFPDPIHSHDDDDDDDDDDEIIILSIQHKQYYK